MSSEKKFRIQNGLDVAGEVFVNGINIVGADGVLNEASYQTAVQAMIDATVAQGVDQGSIGQAVDKAVSDLADAAPATLDTLNELAAALGDDANFATSMTNALNTKLNSANNLSDVADPAAARSNLGLGTAATAATTSFATAAQGAKADAAATASDLTALETQISSGVATLAQGAKADTAVQPEDFFTVADGTTTSYVADWSNTVWGNIRTFTGDHIVDMQISNDGHVVTVHANGGDWPGSGYVPEDHPISYRVRVTDPSGNVLLNKSMGSYTFSGTYLRGNDGARLVSADITDTHLFILSNYGTYGGYSVYSLNDIDTPIGGIRQHSQIGSAIQTHQRALIRHCGEDDKLLIGSRGTQYNQGAVGVKWETEASWGTGVTSSDSGDISVNPESGWIYVASRSGVVSGYNHITNESAPNLTGKACAVGSKYVVVSDYQGYSTPVSVYEVGTSNLVASLNAPHLIQVWGGWAYSKNDLATNGDVVIVTGRNTNATAAGYVYDMASSSPTTIVKQFYVDTGASNNMSPPYIEVSANSEVLQFGFTSATITQGPVDAIVTPNVDASTLASKVYVDNAVANADPDLSSYPNTTEMTTAIATAKTEAQTYADGAVADAIDAAPAALDTLNELAAALGDDANFASTMTTSLASKADDAATTAALATKSDQTDLDTLETFVKGSDIVTTTDISGNGGNYFNLADGSSSNINVSQGPYGTDAFHEVVYKGPSLPSGSYSLDYSVSPGNNSGTSTIAIYPSTFNSWSSSAGHFWSMRYEASKSSQLVRRDISGNGSGTFNFNTAEDFYIVITTQGGGGITSWNFANDALVRTETADSIATTASEIIPAINELHAEISALSGTDTSLTDSISANASAIAAETAARTAAIAAIPSTDLTAYSTTAEMNSAITAEVAATVDAAPAALDTLNELAAALGDDANFASTMTTALAGKASQTDITSVREMLTGQDVELQVLVGGGYDGFTYASGTQQGHLSIFDVNNPTATPISLTIPTSGDGISGVTNPQIGHRGVIADSEVIVASGWEGSVVVWHLNDLENPMVLDWDSSVDPSNEEFGYHIEISKGTSHDTILVSDTYGSDRKGVIHAYHKTTGQYLGQFAPTNYNSYNNGLGEYCFGYNFTIAGNKLIVGAYQDDGTDLTSWTTLNRGVLYSWNLDSATGVPTGNVVKGYAGSNRSEEYGGFTASHGDYFVSGRGLKFDGESNTYDHQTPWNGKVDVFHKDNINTPIATLTSGYSSDFWESPAEKTRIINQYAQWNSTPNPNQYTHDNGFGSRHSSCLLSDDWLIISEHTGMIEEEFTHWSSGPYSVDENIKGVVYVFQRTGDTSFSTTPTMKLTGKHYGVDYFGTTLTLKGNMLVVGNGMNSEPNIHAIDLTSPSTAIEIPKSGYHFGQNSMVLKPDNAAWPGGPSSLSDLNTNEKSIISSINEIHSEIGVLSNAQPDLSAYSTTAEMNTAIANADIAISSSDLDMNGNKVLFANVYSTLSDLPSASTYHGMFAHVHGTGKAYYAHADNWVELADASSLVTQSDIDTAIANADVDLSGYSTTAEMNSAITAEVANVVDAAPAALDTLNELAAALGDDANFASTVTASLATKADDTATTAALATKADQTDLDTNTAAIATKASQTDLDTNTAAIAAETARAQAAEADLVSHLGGDIASGDLTITGTANFNGGLSFGDGNGSIGFNSGVDDIQVLSNMDMQGNKLLGVGTPVDSVDVTTKGYVDGEISTSLSTAAADATAKADAAQAAAIVAAGTAATQAIADTIDAAPTSLDTLNELAAALGDDANFASTVTASLATKADGTATTAAISSETTARESADSDLQSAIDALSGVQSGDTSSLTSQIATAKSQAISTASADATTKADAAQAAAAVDATTKANAAQAQAISTASDTATTLANAAQTQAISTASADATTKADQAEADAKAYADQVVAATVDAAPAALDTLNELAAALGDDANFASTVTASIATKADDAATTAALATKANDSVTTAALATKANVVDVNVIDAFVSGSSSNTQIDSGLTEAGGGVIPFGFITSLGNGLLVKHSSASYIKDIPAGNWEFSYYMSGSSIFETTMYMFSNSVDFDSGSVESIISANTPLATFSSPEGYNTWSFSTSEIGQFVIVPRLKPQYTHDSGWAGMRLVMDQRGEMSHRDDAGFMPFSPTLETTATQVVPAINELHTELNALSSTQSGDVSTLTSDIAAETTARQSAITAETSARESAITSTISTASADATSKANAAQAAAEATASADATSKANAAQTAAEAYADSVGSSAVASVIDAAPATLDTLNELAAALGDDANFASTVTASIATKADDTATTAALATKASQVDLTAETTRATSAETINNQAIAILQNQVSGISTSSGSSNIEMTADVDMSTNKVSNLGTPTSGTDATTKAYVDSASSTETAARIAGDAANSAEVTAAIATASADATAKADSAEADAKAYADQVVASTVDAAPAALDTLNELAAALGDDANFASTVTTSIATKASQVDLDAEAVTRSNLGSQLLGYININGSAISTETSARQTAIVTAKSEAVALAASDATTKSDAAQAAAISTASADATTKANAAQAAAAVDATTKADQAEADAKAYADQVVASTVDAAPDALNTLNELAAALGDDANFASSVTSSIATKADDAATTTALATKADDVATTAALATKADDVATTAALDTKEDKTVVAALDTFVKGFGTDLMDSDDWDTSNGWNLSLSMGSSGSINGNGTGSNQFTRAQGSTLPFAERIISGFEIGKTYELNASGTMSSGYWGMLTLADSSKGALDSQSWTHFSDGVNGQSAQIFIEPNNVTTGPVTFVANETDLRLILVVNTGGSEDGDLTVTDISITEIVSLDTTATQVIPAINELHTEIATLSGTDTTLTASITANTAAITAETSARTTADSTLQSSIDSEVARATAAEGVLTTAVSDETSARTSADTTLQSNIDTVSGRVDTILNGSSTSLDTIVEVVSAFENADSDLQTLISSNAGSHATNATAISTETTRATTAEGALQNAIDTEESARAQAISAEETARITFDASLQDQINALDTQETTSKSSLQLSIDNEVTRATTAEGVNADAISAETTARTSAISAETTARESAVTSAISTASSDATTKADAAEADAIATASADATSKANAAQSAAVSTASADATAKANAAQSAAEATASADATTKADAAQAAAAVDATTKSDAALVSAQTYADNAASTAVANVIDAAPASLDTLNELAAALGDDANFASTVTTSLATKANTADVATAAQGVKADSALQPGDAVSLTVDNSDKLDGQQSSHFRIDIYDINGNIVN